MFKSVLIASHAQVFTGDIPFPNLEMGTILLQSMDGSFAQPRDDIVIARGLDDRMWSLMMDCWKVDPSARPTAAEVAERLQQFLQPAPLTPISRKRSRSPLDEGRQQSRLDSSFPLYLFTIFHHTPALDIVNREDKRPRLLTPSP